MTLNVLDSTGTTKALKTALSSGEHIGATSITDALTGLQQTISQLHNADQQAVPGSANSAFTAGVAQLQDAVSGLVNRQREAGQDNVSAIGITSGAANFAMQFKATCAQNLGSGVTTMTLNAVSGLIGNVPWKIQQGTKLVVDTVASVNVGAKIVTFTQATAFAHNGSVTVVPVIGFCYNQERDAAGEVDGANGSGTAIAAEYMYNGMDPSNGSFDRARALQGKGRTTNTISSGGTVGSLSLTLSSVGGLQPGSKILLYKNSTFPAAGSFETVNVDLSYIPGSTTVPLASAIVLSLPHDRIDYDSFAPLGPQLNGFTPIGIELAEDCVFDPVTGLYFIERAATQDAMPSANIVAEAPVLFNGATMDRTRVPVVFKTLNAVAIGSEATIWTPAGGKKFRVMGGIVSVGVAAGNVLLKDNTAGTTIFIIPKAPLDTPIVLPANIANGILSAAANNVLTATGVATATLSGTIFGTEE